MINFVSFPVIFLCEMLEKDSQKFYTERWETESVTFPREQKKMERYESFLMEKQIYDYLKKANVFKEETKLWNLDFLKNWIC